MRLYCRRKLYCRKGMTRTAMKTDKLLDKCFYIIGWVFIAIGIIVFALYRAGVLPVIHVAPCMIHSMTGYYCPGCGGTRATYALLHGKIITSLYYHPIVVYGSCGRLVYDLTDDRAAFTGKALYWDALQRSVPMDCTCNRNRKLSGEKSCACNHRDCDAWMIA